MKFEKIFTSPESNATSRHACLTVLLTTLIMFVSVSCQQFAGNKTGIAPTNSGAEIFKLKCGKCHDVELSMKEYRSAAVWYLTIARMKEKYNADIGKDEADLLVKYHVSRQQQEAAIFKDKCQKCHPGKAFLEKNLSENQARAIIKRMQQKAGNTIEDQDIEIIVRYHVQAQKSALNEALRSVSSQILANNKTIKTGLSLFVTKCSSCHLLTNALTVIKDPGVWEQTIKRMQSYSKGAITDQEAEELVGFHVSEQQREIKTFKETCTKCHDDKLIISRSMSEEQWLETIKKMQQKAPELITDEKVDLLAAYFHRRELALARIFYGKCQQCHLENSGEPFTESDTSVQMNGLIVLANEEFGKSLQMTDIKIIQSTHVERQQRNMLLYEQKCTTCHIDGIPKEEKPGEKNPDKRSRAEWISFIVTLQGLELNKETQSTTNSQIDYHISKY